MYSVNYISLLQCWVVSLVNEGTYAYPFFEQHSELHSLAWHGSNKVSCPVSESFWHYYHNRVHLGGIHGQEPVHLIVSKFSAGNASTNSHRRKDCAASWVCLDFSIPFVSKQCPLWNDQLSQTWPLTALTYAYHNCSIGVLLSSDFGILPFQGKPAWASSCKTERGMDINLSNQRNRRMKVYEGANHGKNLASRKLDMISQVAPAMQKATRRA